MEPSQANSSTQRHRSVAQAEVEGKLPSLVSSQPKRRTPKVLWTSLLYIVPFTAGISLPVIGALNAAGRETCGSPYFTVALTYTIAVIICGLWAHYTSERTFSQNYFDVGSFVFESPRRHIFCLGGGLLGAAQHIMIAFVSSAGGSSIFTLGSLAGLMIMGIIQDSTGICWARKSRPNLLIYMGTVAVVVGAIVHSLPVLRGDGTESTNQGKMIVCLCVSALSGICMSVQACFGNKLATLVGGFRRAAVWSFLTGALILYLIGPYIVPEAPLIEILRPRNWWQLTQAPLAVYVLAAVAVCQRKLPGAMVYCWVVIGQLLASTLLDTFGWIGLMVRPIDRYKIGGLVVVVAGVALMTISKLVRKTPVLTASISIEAAAAAVSETSNEALFIECASQRTSSIVALSTQMSH